MWIQKIEAIRSSPKSRQALYAFLGLLVVIDIFVPREHVLIGIDAIPGFASAFGLTACLVISLFSKWLGHTFLMKRENYYDS
jgi:hypothetical protein